MASRTSLVRQSLKENKDATDIDWKKVRDVCLACLNIAAEILKETQYSKQGEILARTLRVTQKHLITDGDNFSWLLGKRKLLEEQLTAINQNTDPELYQQVKEQLSTVEETIKGVMTHEKSDENGAL